MSPWSWHTNLFFRSSHRTVLAKWLTDCVGNDMSLDERWEKWLSIDIYVKNISFTFLLGIGYGSTITCFILNIYYIVILSWAFLYLYYSFNLTLPWSTCDNPWNTPACTNETVVGLSPNSNSSATGLTDSVVEFWERKILQVRNLIFFIFLQYSKNRGELLIMDKILRFPMESKKLEVSKQS